MWWERLATASVSSFCLDCDGPSRCVECWCFNFRLRLLGMKMVKWLAGAWNILQFLRPLGCMDMDMIYILFAGTFKARYSKHRRIGTTVVVVVCICGI